MQFKNAIDKDKLNHFVENASTRLISTISHEIGDLLSYWMGNPTIERINQIKKSFPYLVDFIDFQKIYPRLKHLHKFENGDSSFDKYIGVHISKIFPELKEVQNKFRNIMDDLPKGIKKAELVLYPIALEAGANADMEAAIYFAGQGEFLLDPIGIKKEWHENICIDIERGRPLGKVSELVLERAKSRTISLSEASELLKFNDDLPRFFSFRDEEEDFIDATFFRAIEWFNVKGFQPWIDSIAKDLSTAFQYGIEHTRASWKLFFLCRSDLAINKVDRFGLESLLYGLINGTIEREKPWKTTWHTQKTFEYVNYIPTASSIIFSWHRIKPTSFNSNIIENAVELLFQTQLNNGGWPVISTSSEGSVISTCFAMHALAVAKPQGWETILEKAKDWLMEEQQANGCWYIQGGPTVMLTVLALESIHLASGKNKVSFALGRAEKMKSITIKEKVEDIDFDYTNEEWYKNKVIGITSKPKDEVKSIFAPKIAIITAVEVELEAVLKKLKPPKGKRKLWKIIDGGETYYAGRFGEFDAIVTMCNMGSIGASGATLTVDALIREWNPIGIVMVGIAFGVNKKKHQVADVLVASNIIPYEIQRVGEDVVYRSPIVPTSFELISRIRNTFNWEFYRPDKSKVSKHIGQILSGEKLVDNIDFKNKLLEQYPQVIGGEMEGAGLWSAADRNRKS